MSETDLYRNRAELLAKSLRERDEALERCGQKIFDLQQEIVELRVERDMARREVCRWEASQYSMSVIEAARRNEWDCYKGVE